MNTILFLPQLLLMFLSFLPMSSDDDLLLTSATGINEDQNKKVYEDDSITISIQPETCMRNGREQRLQLITYENKTNGHLNLQFERYIYRDGSCTTCQNSNKKEYTFSLKIEPGEKIAGICGDYEDRTLYVFDHFIKKVPGMTKTTVSAVKFKNIQYK